MKEKGLTTKILQRFNQGRGVVTVLLYSLYPLANVLLPQSVLADSVFSSIFAAVLLATSLYVYYLVKDYSKATFIIYGATHLGLAASILLCRSMAALNYAYPLLLPMMHNEAVFVIACVQFGFMLYYMYSRRLVSKTLVQEACKLYHPAMAKLFFLRVQYDAWWSSFPMVMRIQPALVVVMVVAMLVLSKSENNLKKLLSLFKKKSGEEQKLGSLTTPIKVHPGVNRSSSVLLQTVAK
jgi:hypothetical protein